MKRPIISVTLVLFFISFSACAEIPTNSPTPTPIPEVGIAPTPTPKTSVPGFEAVFAIVGLLAVAYLIRRREV